MIAWRAYKLVKQYKKDHQGKKKLDGHTEMAVEVFQAESKVEAQLIAGALYGSHTFVCSILSDAVHIPIKDAPSLP